MYVRVVSQTKCKDHILVTHVFINKIEKPVNNTYISGHCRIYEFDNDIEQKFS